MSLCVYLYVGVCMYVRVYVYKDLCVYVHLYDFMGTCAYAVNLYMRACTYALSALSACTGMYMRV